MRRGEVKKVVAAAAASPRTKRAAADAVDAATSSRSKKARSCADAAPDTTAALDATAAPDATGKLAAAHLIAADARFKSVVAAHGSLVLGNVKSQPTAFAALLKTIVYQQLAGKAAATIHGRVVTAVKADPPTPVAVLATAYADLRGAGLSDRKATYIVDLATHFTDGRLTDALLKTASDEELVTVLTAVKGIGLWSCQIFMMFQLCRPDVLPTGDLGVQKGVSKFFGLGEKKKPSPAEMEELTRAWSPYRSYGSYYMWRSLDVKTPGHKD